MCFLGRPLEAANTWATMLEQELSILSRFICDGEVTVRSSICKSGSKFSPFSIGNVATFVAVIAESKIKLFW